ncbi:MAG: putative thiol oxidoreductase with 2 cytochrome c heme-binding site [Cyanobacteria bacterium RYN_339]|nr:putative thiol oxidoreductase with 2 cytochrome c heme-binding site [Cyanobacteria bacterium RYN_339]
MRTIRILLCLATVLPLAACAEAIAENAHPRKFGLPIDGLSPAQLAQFERGRSKFSRLFTPQTGLGPLYNDNSCRACHGLGASGGPSERVVHLAGAMVNGGPSLLESKGGPMIQDFAVFGTKVEQVPQETTALATRMSPQVWGLGLVEAVAEKDIVSQMAPNDEKFKLGIRGIANWEEGKLGRFGMKAQKKDLKVFTEQAYDWELGITTPDRGTEPFPNQSPHKVAKAELSQDELLDVTFYQRYLDAPPRGPITAEARHGEQLFTANGCALCHSTELTTSPNEIGIPVGVKLHPYSDFLLHVMDEDLADQMVQGASTGQMWRTQPLWGLRVRTKFMHDGRANDLDDAIVMHGGEAEKVRDRYKALSPPEKDAMRSFLKSL